MKKILYILLFLVSSTVFSQTIKKTASNNNPYIGEEFYYTITVENLNGFNLSDLDKITDNLGPGIDYLGVDLSAQMLFMQNLGFCVNYNVTAPNNNFELKFVNCNGQVSGLISSFSFKIKVRLNNNSCGKTEYENKAELYLHSAPSKPIKSNVSTVNINSGDPFVLQKTFRSYTGGQLIYDIRLSSNSGNFYLMDFNSNPSFTDIFAIPSCLTLGANPNDIEVVYISDESTTPLTETAIIYNTNRTATDVTLNWDLLHASSATTSILYQVKIKVDNCTCANQLFNLENQARFDAKDICGNLISKTEQFDIENVMCNNGLQIPSPIGEKICFTKTLKLDNNDLNLTMKGCTGNYIIRIENCSGRIIYKNFNLTDIIPTELDINTPITITGNATFTLNNNNLTVNQTAYLQPNEVVEIAIPFTVNTPLENIQINNCAEIDLYGYDNFNVVYNVNKKACAAPITTVPNKVAVHAEKTICNSPITQCGPFTNYNNLPGDTVEYALHIYNYGTVEGGSVRIEDILPPNFSIQNINSDVTVYKKKSGSFENACDVSAFRDITRDISKRYSNSSRTLKIDLRNNKLDEFTCNGVTHYIVKVKAKIDLNAPNGTYENMFTVNYKDPSDNSSHTTLSNKVTSVVNVDNLVIGYKSSTGSIEDCEAKTKTVTYKIVLANMGTFPVYADINDVLNVPSPINVFSYGNFKKFVNQVQILPFSVPNATLNGFSINGMQLLPCELTEITYEVVYNTNLLSKGESIEVCNNASVKIFTKGKVKVFPVMTSNPTLVDNFYNATSDAEKLEAISIVKSFKAENEKNKSRNGNIDLGFEKFPEVCVTLTDCLPNSTSGCFSQNSASFNFSITGMDSSGNITTSLTNNPANKITKIEYLLTDVRQIKTCEDEVIYIRGRRYTRSCFGCSTNVTGIFKTNNINPISSSLYYVNAYSGNGTYNEQNKVTFSGPPTAIAQDNRSFKFPVGVNCNGTFEFTITAIVYFEDCSICYVTDSYDYNANFRFIIRDPRTTILTGPRI